MKGFKVICLIFLFLTSIAQAAEEPVRYYEGTWKTVGRRKLDGEMNCIVRQDGSNYSGRFYGIWQGAKFSYDVKWHEKDNVFKGKANIDGASYTWSGKISGEKMTGDFIGRYRGSFELKQQQEQQ